jgi:Predicted membrane protein
VVFAQAMPAVTMPGAMIRAMLAAYRRTLQKTMAQARSMQQVVDEAGLDWLDTPDQAVVWGTALGLQSEIEGVLSRSLEDVKTGQASGVVPYFPVWYQTSSGTPFMSSGAGGSGGGLFSDSGIPDVGGMMSALGTIGNSPSSSGSGGGGFSGGSSGGGGGGAGGGF